MGTVYFTHANTAKRHPAWIQAFLSGLVDGWQFVYANYDATVGILQSYDEKTFTEELVRFNLDKQKPYILPDGMRFCAFREDAWRRMAELLKSLELLSGDPDLSTAVTTRFLDDHYR